MRISLKGKSSKANFPLCYSIYRKEEGGKISIENKTIYFNTERKSRRKGEGQVSGKISGGTEGGSESGEEDMLFLCAWLG